VLIGAGIASAHRLPSYEAQDYIAPSRRSACLYHPSRRGRLFHIDFSDTAHLTPTSRSARTCADAPSSNWGHALTCIFLPPTHVCLAVSITRLIPDVRGSRAPSDGTSLIIPRLGAHLALRPTSSSTLNICIQPLLMTTVDPSVLGRRRAGFGSIYHYTCSRYDQTMPRSWTLNRAELQEKPEELFVTVPHTHVASRMIPCYALSSWLSFHVFRHPAGGGAYRLTSEGKQAAPMMYQPTMFRDHSIVERKQRGILQYHGQAILRPCQVMC
jgi:hypothetical protein